MIATPECLSSDQIKQKILATSDGGINTLTTHVFDILSPFDWGPEIIARALKKSETLEKYPDHVIDRSKKVSTEDKRWYQENKDNYNVRAVFSGTGCGLVHEIVPAKQVVEQTVRQAFEIATSRTFLEQ